MKFSILDLVYLKEGQSFGEAYDDFTRMVNKAEEYGYERYWVAEHHNSKAIGSSATQLLILHALSHTTTIRVGSGGVMLPNHNPYLVAEQYATIETLHPGRLDLGLGRAPGTDMRTARALRRSGSLNPDFDNELAELDGYFQSEGIVNAYPAPGLYIPRYILGSSTDSAHLAARLGLPYAFAAHFAPAAMRDAIGIYRAEFQPSKRVPEPYVILALNATVADTDQQARRLATSHTQAILGVVTNNPKGLLPPKENEEEVWHDYIAAAKAPHFGPVALQYEDIANRERAIVEQMTAVSLIGSPDSFIRQLRELRGSVHFDEIMVNSLIYDQEDRDRSYRLLAEAMKEEFAA
ncbi:MAG: LLM class flavin-dependent oxidoreductase [Actinomycetaceae bacterium]|nr:LLM class flavin-dependent oxidoreductase [Actinomycetaceae bacterium]